MTGRHPAVPPPLRPGALVHGPGSAATDALLESFALDLKARGFRVGGVIQRNEAPREGCAELMTLVDLGGGRVYDITQKLGPGSQSCRVDPTGVAEASEAVRRGVAERVELLVVNKFGGLEAGGGGLVQELLAAMAEGVPVLTSVGSRYTDDWLTATGGHTDLLAPSMAALWRWWGPHRLYADLVQGIADAAVRRVGIGEHWVFVETDSAMGLASRPPQTRGRALPPPEFWAGRSLRDLAAPAAAGWDALEVAVGVAALNAHYNHAGVEGPAVNGLDLFDAADGPLVVVGGFPQIRERRPDARVIEMDPKPGEYPDTAADWLVPAAGGVIVTASALMNRTLPRLIAAAPHGRLALVGPGAPLTPRLFAYGIDALCGFVATDRDGVAGVILGGGSSRQFHPFGRMVTLRAP